MTTDITQPLYQVISDIRDAMREQNRHLARAAVGTELVDWVIEHGYDMKHALFEPLDHYSRDGNQVELHYRETIAELRFVIQKLCEAIND